MELWTIVRVPFPRPKEMYSSIPWSEREDMLLRHHMASRSTSKINWQAIADNLNRTVQEVIMREGILTCHGKHNQRSMSSQSIRQNMSSSEVLKALRQSATVNSIPLDSNDVKLSDFTIPASPAFIRRAEPLMINTTPPSKSPTSNIPSYLQSPLSRHNSSNTVGSNDNNMESNVTVSMVRNLQNDFGMPPVPFFEASDSDLEGNLTRSALEDAMTQTRFLHLQTPKGDRILSKLEQDSSNEF